ncbi:uncharacterized protein I303_104053 [Kwoniella dejecticola CBS 10117]|uniref:Uncharacterized protein n=1 Tax=Kwoniella dejecticola CBS 10117 TaxID=1296121 RepID=A0A1A6A8G8_9TREE|nr:uncharacterized protein I303_04072 [Kwoniella dejecticola CBS 10117]OBR86348.1 hypothetical protein I303_04072 [Kwoniella dejecticola CBS 10117]
MLFTTCVLVSLLGLTSAAPSSLVPRAEGRQIKLKGTEKCLYAPYPTYSVSAELSLVKCEGTPQPPKWNVGGEITFSDDQSGSSASLVVLGETTVPAVQISTTLTKTTKTAWEYADQKINLAAADLCLTAGAGVTLQPCKGDQQEWELV